MDTCPECKNKMEELQRGSCGGRGRIMGCEKCNTTYSQKTGGLIATPGGETWGRSIFTFAQLRKKD